MAGQEEREQMAIDRLQQRQQLFENRINSIKEQQRLRQEQATQAQSNLPQTRQPTHFNVQNVAALNLTQTQGDQVNIDAAFEEAERNFNNLQVSSGQEQANVEEQKDHEPNTIMNAEDLEDLEENELSQAALDHEMLHEGEQITDGNFVFQQKPMRTRRRKN